LSALLRTPLYQTHVELGGRMVDFAGFEMPVQYHSIKAEHAAVRERVGLFDVSHMGQIHFRGPEAVAVVENLVTCPVASLRRGRVRYGCLCNEEGGVVDDVTVYRIAENDLFLCVNAANIEKDHRWILRHSPDAAGVRNRSDETALLALQGPAAAPLLARLAEDDVSDLKRFQFRDARLADQPATISRTGYTGSDGFELYLPAAGAEVIWKALLEEGEPFGITPAGLGARDTLRLEAALPLYGHELDETTSPLEARLDRFVKLEAGGFIGAEAIARRRSQGHPRLLAGFVLEGRGVARAGYPIAAEGEEVGVVTSGAPSPTLGKSIGLGYVPPTLAAVGSGLDVMVRGRAVRARVVETPFV
jgi:aminomethyltransferase